MPLRKGLPVERGIRATFGLRKLRVLAAILLSLGIGAVIVGMVLPAYKSPQAFTASGPNVTFTADRNYWIDYYLIPPIDEGTPITLTLVSSKPGRHGFHWRHLICRLNQFPDSLWLMRCLDPTRPDWSTWGDQHSPRCTPSRFQAGTAHTQSGSNQDGLGSSTSDME